MATCCGGNECKTKTGNLCAAISARSRECALDLDAGTCQKAASTTNPAIPYYQNLEAGNRCIQGQCNNSEESVRLQCEVWGCEGLVHCQAFHLLMAELCFCVPCGVQERCKKKGFALPSMLG
eukprot:3536186-Rhodomonas_salina.1